jgi:hypothetical protein
MSNNLLVAESTISVAVAVSAFRRVGRAASSAAGGVEMTAVHSRSAVLDTWRGSLSPGAFRSSSDVGGVGDAPALHASLRGSAIAWLFRLTVFVRQVVGRNRFTFERLVGGLR